MRAKGITYDTGFVRDGVVAREEFDPAVVARELRIIRDDLHCTAVRVTGGDPERIETAGRLAVELGLEVWFSPYPLETSRAAMLALFADCAEGAERLRRAGGEVVLVTGAELSLMNPGFLPGADVDERIAALRGAPALVAEASERVAAFLREAVAVVRERFEGRVTYASVPLERVDWELFDVVSVDLYRSAAVADRFAEGVRDLVAQGRPVAVTEFGAATFAGAADRGAEGLDIVEYDATTGVPLRLDGDYARDEEGQARAVREQLEIFEAEGVDSAFVFLFALHDHVHRPDGDPRADLDRASYGVVKVLDGQHGTSCPGLPWEPKAAFHAVAAHYASDIRRPGPAGGTAVDR